MIQLPERFRDGGFDMRVVWREGMVVMLERSRPGHSYSTWEAAILKEVKETRWPDGKTTPAREVMPRNEDWGRLGFTYLTREQAEEGFKGLVTSREKAAEKGGAA